MAFNTKETELIKWGVTNGKSKEEITQALTNLRIGIIPKPKEVEKPSTFDRIKTGIQEKGEKVQAQIAGTGEFADKSALERGIGATATGFSTLSGTLYNALPEGARNTLDTVGGGIGKGMNYLADKISNNPALQEFANSEAGKDTERVARVLVDLGIISGEILGADQTAKAGKLVDKGVGNVKTKISNTVKDITTNPEQFTQYPKQVIEKLSEKLTRLDPKVKNVLETSSLEKFDRYVKIGEDAVKNPRNLTPIQEAGELVKNKILPAIKEDLGRIGNQKSKFMTSISSKKAPGIATEAIDYIRSNTLALKMTKAERKLVNELVKELEKLGKNPTLGSADKTVDLLQNTLFEKSGNLAIPVTTRVKSLVNQTIGKLNTSVKRIAKETLKSDDYSILNDAYSTRTKMFQELNKAVGQEAAKSGSFFKRFFSPSDAGTKKLFAQIKDIYGVDLAQDATLAKFVMESLGDTRASSLLEQVPLSKGGIVTKGLQAIEKKITKPIPKARSVIKSKINESLTGSIEANTSIDNAIASAKQVIESSPKARFDKLGGIAKLLKQTQTDIVLELRSKGFTDIAKRVESIKLDKISSLEALQEAIKGKTVGL